MVRVTRLQHQRSRDLGSGLASQGGLIDPCSTSNQTIVLSALRPSRSTMTPASQQSQTPRVRTVRFSQISDSYARALSLNESPAVYSWYRDIDLHLTGCETATETMRAIETLLKADLSPRKEVGPSFLYKSVTWESGGSLNESSVERLTALCETPGGVTLLKGLLSNAAIFQSPLYIGKADNLRRRIGEHVSGSNSELRELLAKAGISVEKCLIRYFYLDAPEWRDAEVIVAIEELLTRLAPAAFVRRPG